MSFPETIPESAVITFPDGLPGLGDSHRFLILQPEGLDPIVLLQSVEQENLSLPAAPAFSVRPDYQLRISDVDRVQLAVEPEVPESELVCLIVLILSEGGQTSCNLAAPIVINPKNRLARQVMQLENDYPALCSLGS